MMRRPEELLQRQVAQFLRIACPPPPEGPFWYAVPNGFRRTKAEAGIAKSMGQRAGVPDLMGTFRGRSFGIELKAPGTGRLSDAQRHAHELFTLAGGVVAVCDSLDAVEGFLDVLGVPVWGHISA